MPQTPDGTFHGGVYRETGAPDFEAESGWTEDQWDTTGEERQQTEKHRSVLIGAGLKSSGAWDAFLGLGRRLFSREGAQPPVLGQALFGGESLRSAAQASALVPLLRGVDKDEEAASTPGEALATSDHIPLQQGGSRQDPYSAPLAGSPDVTPPYENLACQATDLANDRQESSSISLDVWRRRLIIPRFNVHEHLEPAMDWILKGTGVRKPEPQRIQGSVEQQVTWKQKAMEVLPVFGVVALAVLCTFIYLVIVDGIWPERRSKFSLSCDIGAGQWVRSNDRPLYSRSCPYIRDAWNCYKYGLEAAHDTWRWEPATCTIPQFDPHEVLQSLQGKRVGFVGDRSAANAYDSFVCMLAEAEAPRLVNLESRSEGGNWQESANETGDQWERSEYGEDVKEVGSEGPAVQSSFYRWPSLNGWSFPRWKHQPGEGEASAEEQNTTAVSKELLEAAWKGMKMEYYFPLHNFSLLLYESPFLVEAVVATPVNGTACQLSKFASVGNYMDQSESTAERKAGEERAKIDESATGSLPAGGSGTPGGAELVDLCYPNRLVIDHPDPLWARDASQLDVLVLNSGRGWREEEAEMKGLGIYYGGERRAGMSVEGFVGEWAYPRAVSNLALWLGNVSNFKGTALFRAYAPGHHRRECGGRMMTTGEQALTTVSEHDYEQYNEAVVEALQHTSVHYLNVSSLSVERGDGHPWMYSPKRPRPDCTSWCLPGVPDTWNEVLAAALTTVYKSGRSLR